jgi:hypothetical protein
VTQERENLKEGAGSSERKIEMPVILRIRADPSEPYTLWRREGAQRTEPKWLNLGADRVQVKLQR